MKILNKIFKTILLSVIFIFLITDNSFAQQGVAINTTGANPDSSAILDISSSNQGLLIPRVQLIQTTSPFPITTTPLTSLLVYNIAPSMDVVEGFYYWDGTKWVQAIGPQGTQGATGVAGADGATGVAGAQGATGVAGADGATGVAGAQGATGIAGADGATGVAGVDGVTGIAGADGATGYSGTTVISGVGARASLIVLTGGDILYKNPPLSPSYGIVLKDTVIGGCWKLGVDQFGNLTTQSVTCP